MTAEVSGREVLFATELVSLRDTDNLTSVSLFKRVVSISRSERVIGFGFVFWLIFERKNMLHFGRWSMRPTMFWIRCRPVALYCASVIDPSNFPGTRLSFPKTAAEAWLPLSICTVAYIRVSRYAIESNVTLSKGYVHAFFKLQLHCSKRYCIVPAVFSHFSSAPRKNRSYGTSPINQSNQSWLIVNQSINQPKVYNESLRLIDWLIDLIYHRRKIAPRGWFPGGSKKWPNTAGQ